MPVSYCYGKFKNISCFAVANSFLGIVLLISIINYYYFDSTKTTKFIHAKDEDEDYNLVSSLDYYYRNYNIEIEEIKINTADGYKIVLWHLKRDSYENTKPLLFVHGLLQSAGSFATGGKKSLAYYFYQNGYDVYLGNNRVGFYIDHVHQSNDKDYWNWDITEMAKYDLTSMINHVSEFTQHDKITVCGHSQGTTQIFLSLIQNYDNVMEKIENVIALAPAIYPGSLLFDNTVLRVLSLAVDSSRFLGDQAFLRMMVIVRNWIGHRKIYPFIAYAIFNYLFEWSDKLWDRNLRDRHFVFSPVYVSVKLMKWWVSDDPTLTGFKYKSHLIFPEFESWFKNQDSNKIPNIMFFIPKLDKLVDNERLVEHFENFEDSKHYKIWLLDDYSHLDVLWATDVLDRVGEPILKNLH